MARQRKRRVVIPHYTGSLDARIPSENIVSTQRIVATGKWLAISEASHGGLFQGYAATEPLARRAAGLSTFMDLKERAEGLKAGLTLVEITAAQAELLTELTHLRTFLESYNDELPSAYSKALILVELETARKLLALGDKGALARWLLPPLVFLSGAFAEGIIGEYASRALAALEKLLAG